MSQKIFIIQIVSLFMFSTQLYPNKGQNDLTYLKNWSSFPVPVNYDTLYEYSCDKNDWFVYFDGNEVRVDDIRNCQRYPGVDLPFEIKQSNNNVLNVNAPLAGLIDASEVDDGYLVGFNRGEWGGELYWFSKNGQKKI